MHVIAPLGRKEVVVDYSVQGNIDEKCNFVDTNLME